MSVKVGGDYMFYLIVFSLDIQLIYNFQKFRRTVYESLFVLWPLALPCWGGIVHIQSSFYFISVLLFPFQPIFSSPLNRITGICWLLVLTSRTGGVDDLSASLPVLDHFPTLLV